MTFIIPKKIAEKGYEVSMRYFCNNLGLEGELDVESNYFRGIYIGDKYIRLWNFFENKEGEVVIQSYDVIDKLKLKK